MKYEIGDKILVLHSDEEGKIVEIINDNMVMVNVRGVNFPVHTDQIDFPYYKMFTQKKQQPFKTRQFVENIKREKSSKYKVAEGVWLAFVPLFDKDIFDDDVVEKFKIYLVNQTEEHFNFNYILSFNGVDDFELKNDLLPLSDFYLHDVPFEDLNDAPKFSFEFSLAKENKKKAEYYECAVKLKGKQIFQKIEEIKIKQEASFSYILFEQYPNRVVKERAENTDLSKLAAAGFKVYDANLNRSGNPPRTVVDLHIEKITDNWKGMSNLEKLDLQLSTFEKYLDQAIEHQQHLLIVVHGVGKGKLKEEIHEILKTRHEVKSFVNQFHPSFGYGATEIYL